jgi:polar amino acid transport system substrate-binding protein
MRKLLILVILGLAPLALPSIARADSVTFTTEEYPPFVYRDGKEIKGAASEQVQQVMAAIGADYTIEVQPWARAFAAAQKTPMTCVFATAHNAERDKLFKWIEPLLIDRSILIKHAGTAVDAKDLDAAKHYIVGTWREDYTEKLLRQYKFPRIDVATDFKATLKKLMSDRIDLMPMSVFYFDKLKQDGQAIESVVPLSQQPLSIACEKDFPDNLQHKMQAALDKLIADGTQKRIFLKYGLHLDN